MFGIGLGNLVRIGLRVSDHILRQQEIEQSRARAESASTIQVSRPGVKAVLVSSVRVSGAASVSRGSLSKPGRSEGGNA